MSEKPRKSYYEYPYPSSMAEGVRSKEYLSYTEPGFSLEKEMNDRNGPFLEIGGPSDLGYVQLEGIKLKTRIAISNVTENTQKYSPNAKSLRENTDLIIDGRRIPFPDKSLGVVLSSHLPVAHEDSPDNNANEEWKRWERARKAPRQAVEQGRISDDVLEASLPLKVANEVSRVLEPGGIYVTDADRDTVAAMQLMGFQLREWIERPSEDRPYYYVVLQKPNFSSE